MDCSLLLNVVDRNFTVKTGTAPCCVVWQGQVREYKKKRFDRLSFQLKIRTENEMYCSKQTWLASAVVVCCILLVPGNEAQRQRPNIFALFRQNFASRVGLVYTSTTTTTVTTTFTTTQTVTVTTEAPAVVEATALADPTLNPLALAALLSLEGSPTSSQTPPSTTTATTTEPTSSTESTTTTTTTTENSLLDTTLASTATSESPVIASPINTNSSSSTTLRSRPTSRLASTKRSSSSTKRPSLVLATDSNRFFGPGRESKLGKEELNQDFKYTPVST